MIQFLGRWLDPKHVLTISEPFYNECTIDVQVYFMFRDAPLNFHSALKTGRIPDPNILPFIERKELTQNERFQYERMWDQHRKDVITDYKLQAAEFAESEEYKSFLEAVERAKNTKPSPEMPELFESKEPKV